MSQSYPESWSGFSEGDIKRWLRDLPKPDEYWPQNEANSLLEEMLDSHEHHGDPQVAQGHIRTMLRELEKGEIPIHPMNVLRTLHDFQSKGAHMFPDLHEQWLHEVAYPVIAFHLGESSDDERLVARSGGTSHPLQIEVRDVSTRNGGVVAAVRIETENMSGLRLLFSSPRLQLDATESALKVAREIAAQLQIPKDGDDWEHLVREMVERFDAEVARLREDQPVVRLGPPPELDVSTHIQRLVDPLIEADAITMLVGPKGTGKSRLAVLASVLVASGVSTGVLTPNARGRTLFVDAESSETVFWFYVRAFIEALGLNDDDVLPNIAYLRIHHGIVGDGGRQVSEAVEAVKPTLVVFDSLSLLVPGKDTANVGNVTELMAVARSTGCASLVIHHPTKGGAGKSVEQMESSGSYVSDLSARAVWNLGSVKSTDPDQLVSELFLKYANNRPVGRKLEVVYSGTFSDDDFVIHEVTVRNAATKEPSNREKVILALAGASGDEAWLKSGAELGRHLGIGESVRTVLVRLRNDGLVDADHLKLTVEGERHAKGLRRD